MSIPTGYDETGCANLMLSYIDAVAGQMGWTGLSNVQESVNETILAYGVTDIANCTDIRKVRTLARREIWRQVRAATSGSHDFEADGGKYSMSQIHAMACSEFDIASNDAVPFDTQLGVKITAVTYNQDPYRAGFDEGL